MSKTAMSLFTGFGLADVGMMNAGYELICGLEIDPRLAEVANYNLGGHVRVEDILDADPSMFPKPDLLHASPPCPNFSVAKAGAVETEYDIALAEKVAEFIRELRPHAFTLENVPAYVRSKSYKIILKALSDCGYMYDARLLNSADFLVPQTRCRLFVRAVLGGLVPNLPEPTQWMGWYEAIEDLIPTLPESKFADWQLKRLALLGTTMVDSAGFPDADGVTVPVQRSAAEPVNTVVSNYMRRKMRAFIMAVQGEASNYRDADEPSPVVTVSHSAGEYRTFLMGDQERQYASPDEPAMTVRALTGGGATPRAFIISQGVSHDQKGNEYDLGMVSGDDPAYTVTGNHNQSGIRAWLESGRVVSMTPRALARFQTLPDWCVLPEKRSLACLGIGNGVPCLMMQRIAEGF